MTATAETPTTAETIITAGKQRTPTAAIHVKSPTAESTEWQRQH